MSRFVLLVHPLEQVYRDCKRILEKKGYRLEHISDSSHAPDLIRKYEPDLVLTGIRMLKIDGYELLRQSLIVNPALPVIAITTHATIPGAVSFLQKGGANYLSVPFTADQLIEVVQSAVPMAVASADLVKPDRLRSRRALDAIIGSSPVMSDLKRTILKVARTDVNLLIRGETGTGKELVAKAVHESSARADRLFLPVDCASIPSTLLESELFGHEKGAFTGADRARAGLFEAAHGGTMFLDEIGEMDISTQSKLFRVLQEGRIRQIGSRRSIPVDVRVISATNRDLEQGMQDATFREELFWRLNVVTIFLPALRERKEDISLLSKHFFERFRILHNRKDLEGMAPSFLRALMDHDWPGNVRELVNVIERAVVLAEDSKLTEADFPNFDRVKEIGKPHESETEDDDIIPDYSCAKAALIDTFDREYFQLLLSKYKGNLSEAARRSGIGRKTLYNKLKRVGLVASETPHPGCGKMDSRTR